MTPVEALGKVITELREKRGLHRQQLAKAAKLSNTHLDKIEKGKLSTVRLGVLSRIAMVFGLTQADLTLLVEKRMQHRKRSR